ncbi:hypothetical protein [Limosilactobacillus agrestimuris]|uniref:hypothetical protein n=1 Tax=Limosilactobacillus agrestimuris TaxID=2941331 RepID=UPI00203DFB67|nr:hypothetical protein [Limosilactobacillus agrestimuris]
MSALLELVKETPPEDRKAVAEYLKPYLMVEEKEPIIEQWVGIEELRPYTPDKKAKAWIQLYILKAYPETRKWSTNPYPGKGRPIKVNLPAARKWIEEHISQIDWNKPMP